MQPVTEPESNALKTLTRQFVAAVALSMAMLLTAPHPAPARTQLRNICTIYGQKETPIIGIGLVVGLSHTGDGGKNAAAKRALASTMR
jgi:flagellar basal body P-ring protein FlgI